jgi:uncharacterized protein (DUF433 family)/type I restriction-modification system DNA methylase subunit
MATDPKSKAKDAIAGLVSDFQKGVEIYKDARKFDEAKVRAGFIDPFFEALGWPVKEGQRKFGRQREIVIEDRAGKGSRRRPDYGFYAAGDLKFYVEAKAPHHEIGTDIDAAYQLKTYVWSQRAPLGLLTNFEELLAYHGAYKPRRDKPALGRVARLTMKYVEYADNIDKLFDTLSREAVQAGAVERVLAEELAASVRQQEQLERDLFKARGAIAVDADFLASLTNWRKQIAQELARRNDFKDGAELTEAVQRFLDRLVFTRVAEDRGIERVETLGRTLDRWERDEGKKPLYNHLIALFERLAVQFNGTLFKPHPLSDRALFEDDKGLAKLIRSMYFPESAYRFDAMPVEMLGQVYERFLGSVVRVTEGGHQAKVEEKPEVRHAGGVYYTPAYIVEAIVEKTLAPLLKDATPDKALQMRILDPACGSGSFLLGAYQFLIDWHLRHYARSENPARGFRGACYVDADGNLRLTLRRKAEILTSCLYGVDIDQQAVEVAQMSLYLKLMEDEGEETLALQRSQELFKAEKYLPPLGTNIKHGNSLIGTQDLDPGFPWSEQDEKRINAFDWVAETTGFGEIVRPESKGGHGGFDAVIGNPPYIRVQALTEWAPVEVDIYKKIYATAAEGNYDIYVVFLEKGLQLLRSSGRLGFIVPTKWWQAGYGQALRDLLRKGHNYSDAIDFAHEQVFDDPTTYTCISIFTKTPTQAIGYQRMSPERLRRDHADAKSLWAHAVPWTILDDGPWYLGVRSSVRPLFERLRREGPFLGDERVCTRVFQGLKTSLDPVYVLNVVERTPRSVRVFSKALDRELELEPDLLKPIVKGAEMKRFTPLPPRKVILFPYTVASGQPRLLTAKELADVAPLTWKYLLANKTALERREKGRFKGPAWYQYGRSQALDVVSQPKLLTADLADRMAFSMDTTGDLYILGGAAGGYGLLPAKPECAAPLLALLNSKLLEWMLRPPGFSSPFRGGWFSCEARFINLLPIRFPKTAKEMEALATLALRAVEAYRKQWLARSDHERDLAARQIEAIESEIDDRVFALYGVTADERREVERLVAEARAVSEGGDEDRDAPRLRLFIEERVHSRPDILGGEPVFKGTRISVRDVGERVKRGEAVSDVLEDFPGLRPDDIELARLYVDASPAAPIRDLEFVRGEG